MAQIIVVGGGLSGMLTARELADNNNQVTLLEKTEMARESTWAGGGILSPLYPWRYTDSVTALASWSQQIYPGLCESLQQTTGIDPQYNRNGLLIISPEEAGIAHQWAERHGSRLYTVNRDEVITLESNLSNPPVEALWMPQVGQVRNPRLAKALIVDIQQRGVSLLLNRPVTGLYQSNGRITGVHTQQGTLEADAVVICAGAWTAKLLSQYIIPPSIHPVRGQMLLFKAKPGLIQRIVLEENRYIIPRSDGRVLFGSTLEDVGFEKQTTQAARDELYSIAIDRFPVLKQYQIEKQWAGLRPSSPAGIPYIAGHPNLPGLYINAGHFRNGVVLGPASARLCADLIMGREPLLPPAPYSLFATRDQDKPENQIQRMDLE